MGSFFLLCDIYLDRLIQFTMEGHKIWVNAIKQCYYYYYQAILYIFLMIHCLLWKCIFYCNYFQNALLVAYMEKWHRSHDITGWNLGHACGEYVLKYLIKYLLVQNIAPTSACVWRVGGAGGWLGWLGGRLRWECAGVRTLRSALQICKWSIVLN